MHHWRISKYDPQRRNVDGSYRDTDWTSMSDIGIAFNGVTLTREEYVRVEGLYIDSVLAFYDESNKPTLYSLDVELNPAHDTSDLCSPGPIRLSEGEEVAPERLADLVRLCLRECLWCRLESRDSHFSIHFGYDYYTYVSSACPCDHACIAAANAGLFVEPYLSPYLPKAH